MTEVEVVASLTDQSNSDYHADTSRVGHSMLEVYRESPITYHARFVTKTINQPASTPAMMLGTALHAILLETDRFDELVVVAPDCDRRTKDGKAQWEMFQSSRNGRAVIDSEQNDIVTAMAKSVLEHPEAAKLFQRAEHREKSLLWTNEATGILCKCKPDLLWSAGVMIGDLKTANDPTPGPWSRQAANLGYARQTAHYSDGVESLLGKRPRMVHIVVGTKEPFECACYFLNPEDIEHAAFQNQKALNDLAMSFQTGNWLAPHNREISVISLPKWTQFED